MNRLPICTALLPLIPPRDGSAGDCIAYPRQTLGTSWVAWSYPLVSVVRYLTLLSRTTVGNVNKVGKNRKAGEASDGPLIPPTTCGTNPGCRYPQWNDCNMPVGVSRFHEKRLDHRTANTRCTTNLHDPYIRNIRVGHWTAQPPAGFRLLRVRFCSPSHLSTSRREASWARHGMTSGDGLGATLTGFPFKPTKKLNTPISHVNGDLSDQQQEVVRPNRL
jgi:hypothetical protein